MLRNPKYRRQIILPPVIAAIVLTTAMSWVFLSANSLIQFAQHKIQISDAKYEAVKLLNSIVISENSLRGYLLTGNIEFLQAYNESTLQIDVLMNKLRNRKIDTPEIEPSLANLEKLLPNKLNVGKDSLQIQPTIGFYASHLKKTTNKNKAIMDKIRREIKSIDNILQAKSQKADYQLTNTLNKLKKLSFAIVIIMITILFFNYKRTIWLFENASSIKELADKFGHLAMHDALTKLPNRRNFEQYLKKTISQTSRNKQKIGLLYMDLDGFKLINDQFGHDAGDRALIAATQIIHKTLRDSDFFARVGGDEFVLIANQFNGKDELQAIANRIIESLHPPIIDKISGNHLRMGISIGIAIYPDNVKSSEDLITAADQSMYRAKTSGKNQAFFYS